MRWVFYSNMTSYQDSIRIFVADLKWIGLSQERFYDKNVLMSGGQNVRLVPLVQMKIFHRVVWQKC